MTAAAAAADAGSGASAPAAAVVPPYDAWGVDASGETEPRGSHATIADAHSAGDVVIHARAVVLVRREATDATITRVLADVLGIDLRAIRRELDAAVAPTDVVTAWVRHLDALERCGERARTGLWLTAYGRAQELEPRLTAAELRRRISARLDHPAPRRPA